jgi:hypothetical protein
MSEEFQMRHKFSSGFHRMVHFLVSCLPESRKKKIWILMQDLDRAKMALDQRAASEILTPNGRGNPEFGYSCRRVARIISKFV